MIEDIGKYKPEDLKLRSGDQVVDYFLNGLDRSNGSTQYYAVVYKTDDDDYYIIKTSKTGKYGFGEESYYDVILKTPPEPTLNLADYLDKPEKLQTRCKCQVIAIHSNVDVLVDPDSHSQAYLVLFKNGAGLTSAEHYYKNGVRYLTEETSYDIILKPKVKEFDLADYLGRHELLETEAGYQVLALIKTYHGQYAAFIETKEKRIITVSYKSSGKAAKKENTAWTLKLKGQG